MERLWVNERWVESRQGIPLTEYSTGDIIPDVLGGRVHRRIRDVVGWA